MCYKFVGRDIVAMVIEENATHAFFKQYYNISHFFIDSCPQKRAGLCTESVWTLDRGEETARSILVLPASVMNGRGSLPVCCAISALSTLHY